MGRNGGWEEVSFDGPYHRISKCHSDLNSNASICIKQWDALSLVP